MSIAAQIDTITQTSPKKVHRYRVGKYLGEKLKKTLVRKYVSIIVLFARYAPGRRKLDKFRSFSVGYHFKAIKPDVAVPEVGGRYPTSRCSCLDLKNVLIEN